MSPVKVKITYCAECGYEPQTLELTKALMYEFGTRLTAIEIIPCSKDAQNDLTRSRWGA